MSTQEVQRAARGCALEHGHKMGEWKQSGDNLPATAGSRPGSHAADSASLNCGPTIPGLLECACTDCGFQIGVNLNTSQTYGLALSTRCPGPKDKEAA